MGGGVGRSADGNAVILLPRAVRVYFATGLSPPARRAPFSTGITGNQGTTFAVRFLPVQRLLSDDQIARPMVITAASA
jgi:hypothetical protein